MQIAGKAGRWRAGFWTGALAVLCAFQIGAAVAADVCWKKTSTRPVASVPNVCGPGNEIVGGVCYSACQPRQGVGFTGVGILCYQNCPPGYHSSSPLDVSCGKPAGPPDYTRPSYVLWEGDKCRQENGQCEQIAGIWYATPRPGYTCAGLRCYGQRPGCPAGYHDDGVATCIKKLGDNGTHAYGRQAALPQCGSGLENQAGLCYQQCPSGSAGVGVVCWGNCANRPEFPVDCGALCGKTAAACTTAISAMAQTVVSVVGDAIGGDVPDAGAVVQAYSYDTCDRAQP